MSKDVVTLPKNSFFSNESIEIHVLPNNGIEKIGIYVSPIKMTDEPQAWTLIHNSSPNAYFVCPNHLAPGLYALGAGFDDNIEICTVFKVSDSSMGVVQTSALLFASGLVSGMLFTKAVVLSAFNR